MSDRDPRVEPKPGDVLRHRGGRRFRRICETEPRDTRVPCHEECSADGLKRRPEFIVLPTKAQFRRWAKGAEVVRQAP